MRTATSISYAQVLNTFQTYEDLRINAESVTRIGSIDVAQTEEGLIAFCHLAMVMPFSQLLPERTPVDLGVLQGQAAVMLAIEHLNTGNGTVVEEVERLDDRCPIKFTAEMFDSSYSPTVAVDTIISLVSRKPELEQVPCAFLGARWSSVSIPTSTVTGIKGYPQISPISTSASLDDKGQFPLFGRTIPSDAGTAIPAILYLRYQLGIKHLAIVHVNDAYGDAYSLGLESAAEEYAPDMEIQSISFEFDITEDIAQRTIRQLKDTNFRYIFGIFFSNVQYIPLMTEAYNQGVAGTGEHFWLFSDSVSPDFFTNHSFEVDSPVYLASIGAARIGAVAGVAGSDGFDNFLETVIGMNNPVDIALIQSKHPKYDDPNYKPLEIEDNAEKFFRGFDSTLVPFLYDATIALGLAACGATKDDSFFEGIAHFDTFKKTTFGGATGNNTFDSETGSRVAASARFTLLNIVEQDGTMATGRLKTVTTNVFHEGEWETVIPFIFGDGTTTGPPDLPRLVVEKNYIGWPLRSAGWVMAVIIVAMSAGFGLWTYKNRMKKVAKASQPMFLYMICAGCSLMGLSIISNSADDEIASVRTCTVLCLVPIWMFCVGWILAFSALFAKTLRVNKIFHNPVAFSRIKVTVWDVIKPVVALLSIAMIILLLWSLLNPPTFSRESSGYDRYGRVSATKGACFVDDSVAYIVSLMAVLAGTLIYAVQQAYVARHISTQFAEAEWIFLVLLAVFMVTLLGLPVLFLVGSNPGARFFSLSVIVFIINFAILCLIFVPKVKQGMLDAKALKEKQNSSNPGSSRLPLGDVGSNRISISGINLSKTSDSGQVTSSDDEDLDDNDSGIRILDPPKKVEKLEQKIEKLKQEIEILRRRRNRGLMPSVAECGEGKEMGDDDDDEEDDFAVLYMNNNDDDDNPKRSGTSSSRTVSDEEDLELRRKDSAARTVSDEEDLELRRKDSDSPVRRRDSPSPVRRIDMSGDIYEANVV
eukprot:scaffold23584_cov127-Cylindrotheca_fusiformis.AAC.3